MRRAANAVIAPSQPGQLYFGPERDALLARAKIHLNLRDNAAGSFESVRVSYLLAKGGFVISSPSTTMPWAGGYAVAAGDEMVEACRYYLERPDLRREIAQRGHSLFKADRMAGHLAEALADLDIPSADVLREDVEPCDSELNHVLSKCGVAPYNGSFRFPA